MAMARFLVALGLAVVAGYFTIKFLVSALGSAFELAGTLIGLAVTVLVFWFASQELMKGYQQRKANRQTPDSGADKGQP